MRPRVRFAPSPTGALHVGGVRTALFNWLFAKSQGGELILRVEDTDRQRSTAESEAAILDGLRWCGLTWDEGPDVGGPHGPYRQSERYEAGLYQEPLQRLVTSNKAYKCFLTAEDLDEMRAEADRNGQAFVVNSPWAHASESQVRAMLDQGKPYVYRFRVPRSERMVVQDLVLGEVQWNSDDLGGDFVIVRQTGVPMYNFSVVVDDASMRVSHVLRAQEHLMNTPRQVLIYEALGLPVPIFGHMPLILNPDRRKLSKRDGAVSVAEFEQEGYLPSGLINYLAQLGWNDGTNQEIYDTNELVSAFTMERMGNVAAIFDVSKLNWVNSHHIRELRDDALSDMVGAELVKGGLAREPHGEFVRRASSLIRNRISTFGEVCQELKSMMEYPLDQMLADDRFKQWVETGALQETAACILRAKADGDLDSIGRDPSALQKLVERLKVERPGVKKKALLTPLRLCLTAKDAGPDMSKFFHMLAVADGTCLFHVIGLEQRLTRLEHTFGRARSKPM